MGIWVELGIFVLVLAFGLWQIHDVGQERKRSAAKKEAGKIPPEEGPNVSPE
jgi:hypothetical protein